MEECGNCGEEGFLGADGLCSECSDEFYEEQCYTCGRMLPVEELEEELCPSCFEEEMQALNANG